MSISADEIGIVSEEESRHAELVRKAAEEGIVLLENDGVLPLKGKGKIALFGNGARQTVKGGSGSGDVFPRHYSSIEEGLENAGFTITSKEWIDLYSYELDELKNETFARVIAALSAVKTGEEMTTDVLSVMNHGAGRMPKSFLIDDKYLDISETDTCVYVISRTAGETADRTLTKGDYYLYEEEYRNLQKIAALYSKVIVVINAGGAIDTQFFKQIKGLDALVLLSQGGQCGGDALANILSGEVTPSGKLSATWARRYTDYPNAALYAGNNGNPFDEYYHEGIYVGYAYFDTYDVSPAYEFGFGRSYTEFELTAAEACQDHGDIVITARVKNVGDTFSGKEVLQAYYSAPDGKLRKPKKRLGAFAKTKSLAPSESTPVELRIPIFSMGSYDSARAAYILEPGEYVIHLGASSRCTKVAARFNLSDELVIEQLKNRMTPDTAFDEFDPLGFEAWSGESESAAPVIEIDVEQIVYQEQKNTDVSDRKIAEIVDGLSVEDLAFLVNGESASANADTPLFSGQTAPGAAGETTRRVNGIPSVLLADGPAGLRLLDRYQTDEQEYILNLEYNFLAMFLGAKRLFEERDGVTNHFQYTTALPVGTLLAQTFNTELVETVGRAVREEMKRFGIQIWLAPGMNIQRNPLCGRNFEYYSEDPLLSGKMAAAMTRGVQSVYGSVTIKHFAGNNQENMRTECNDHISERALREVYLKGFEIAVKEGKPNCIMTSYNLINGIHTANNADLCTGIAREEWGFDGIIMSDWGTTASTRCHAVDCIKAGNDLIMPGGKQDVDEIVEAIKTGELKLEKLRECAARVLRCISRTTALTKSI